MPTNEVYHGRYKPSSRIILKSNDGQLFSVSRTLLVKNSMFFRDLFQLPGPTPGPQVDEASSSVTSIAPLGEEVQQNPIPQPTSGGAQSDNVDEVSGLMDVAKTREVASAPPAPSEADKAVAVTPSTTLVPQTGSPAPAGPQSAVSGQQGSTSSVKELKGSEHRSRGKRGGPRKAAADRDGGSAKRQKVGDADHPIEERQEQRKSLRTPKVDSLDIDAGWATLALFVDLLKAGELSNRLIPVSSLQLKLKDIQSVLPLLKKFDCPRALTMIRVRLDNLAIEDPWSVFALASDEDDIEVARVAIARMVPRTHFYSLTHRGHRLWKEMSRIRESWHLPFLKLIGPSPVDQVMDENGRVRPNRDLSIELTSDLKGVAKAFDPYPPRSQAA